MRSRPICKHRLKRTLDRFTLDGAASGSCSAWRYANVCLFYKPQSKIISIFNTGIDIQLLQMGNLVGELN
jgi:hypothetical protein